MVLIPAPNRQPALLLRRRQNHRLDAGKPGNRPEKGMIILMSEWILYIIRTATGELYTGITLDLERRFREHSSEGPKSARYLRGRGPLRLVFSFRVGDSRSAALKLEVKVKRLPHSQKEQLVSGRISCNDLLQTVAPKVRQKGE